MSSRRLSQSLTGSWRESSSWSLPALVNPTDDEVEDWLVTWRTVFARDLIDSRIVEVDADKSVEDACELLLDEDIPCLTVRSRTEEPNSGGSPYHGLFDYADVNAFLTLAATRHTFLSDDSRGSQRVNDIVTAAKAGRVPVHLVSNLSDKNPIEILPHNATLISLLGVFARGAHRILIESASNPREYVGMVSDRRLLSWFNSYARETPSFNKYLSNPIQSLSLPSLDLNDAVVAAKSSASILDAMKLMSEQGVSSIAVLEENAGTLLSAVSVTDIGKIVVPSESNQILTTPLHYFISQIKEPYGSTDGADAYPVYSVFPSNLLSYTIDKILATNAHRVFVTKESGPASPILSPSFHGLQGNLTGIVSIVDILSLFARSAKIANIILHRCSATVAHHPPHPSPRFLIGISSIFPDQIAGQASVAVQASSLRVQLAFRSWTVRGIQFRCSPLTLCRRSSSQRIRGAV
ncbi:hypothetical protein M413DRAFT_270231 [Hebeloma cylindrosporum]|uniref:CBS domain-containing protein n=1 Tax=Hebeloma cylindrosporum TaxID=76867 RepID=A0A0C3CEF0_HEBCY|nr:hypothetical protein M413DRAFT_270231 [Hebeloma cylindrosporum h7]